MTALEAACERDFAFAAYSANAPFFRTTIRMREDGKTLSTEQLQWLLKGSNLGIEACSLLLHCAKGACDSYGRHLALRVFGNVDIRDQGDAVAVFESDLGMVHLVALLEGLVPLLFQFHGFAS